MNNNIQFKDFRLKSKLSQSQYAELLGFSKKSGYRTVQRIEAGEYEPTGTVLKLMKFLRCKDQLDMALEDCAEYMEEQGDYGMISTIEKVRKKLGDI